MQKIVNRLKRKPFIIGVTRWRLIDWIGGIVDYKNHQLCNTDGRVQTPWIVERSRRLAAYDQKVYNRVDEELEVLANQVAGECKELELISIRKQPAALDKENEERATARLNAQIVSNENRKKEILIHLAKLKADVETIDTAVQHHLHRACNLILSHMSAYWRGVLKAAASEELPPTPDIPELEASGRKRYEELMQHILNDLDKALAGTQEV